jgi:hypothetical protein
VSTLIFSTLVTGTKKSPKTQNKQKIFHYLFTTLLVWSNTVRSIVASL